jgi:hypothetical protein
VYDLFVDESDRILIWLDDKVVIYDNNGQQMSTLSTPNTQIWPRGVIVSTNSILLLDRNCLFVC